MCLSEQERHTSRRNVFCKCLKHFGNALTGFLCCTSDTTFETNPRCWATKHTNKTRADEHEVRNNFTLRERQNTLRWNQNRSSRENSQKWTGGTPVLWFWKNPTHRFCLQPQYHEITHALKQFTHDGNWCLGPTRAQHKWTFCFKENANKTTTLAMTACCPHQQPDTFAV